MSARRERVAGRLALIAVAVAVLAFAWALFQPLTGGGSGQVRVVIPKRSSVEQIAGLLDEAGVVPSATLFQLRAALSGKRGDLKPGVYYLREGMSYGDLLGRLAAGPPRGIVQLTIPEGLSREEISGRVRKAGLRGSYVEASVSSDLLDPRTYGATRKPSSLEGFLFPATYELRRGTSAETLVSKQLRAFRPRFAGVNLSDARRKNLTDYDVLTIASMIEREAQAARERPLIAAVIYNRLREDQPLGVDATIRYATGNWRSPLTKEQLALDSPYNTRTRAGLPPGPIGNPGLDSIEAAARPARVDYLYYVVKPGTCGEHAFSSTFEAFEADRRRYQAARSAAGGRAPTRCP